MLQTWPMLPTVRWRNHPLQREMTVEVPSLQDGLELIQKLREEENKCLCRPKVPRELPLHVLCHTYQI